MDREEKIKFIVDYFPEFNEETPEEWKDELRKDLIKMSDGELQEEYEFVDYLLDK